MATIIDAQPKKAPTDELGVDVFAAIPGWQAFGGGSQPHGPSIDREYVPELRWPRSVTTYERMHNDTQLSGLFRGTSLPVSRYVWGIDPNGADPNIVAATLRDFNMEEISAAWESFQTGESKPVPRARNDFTLSGHFEGAITAARIGHAYFEVHGDIDDDGLQWGAKQAQFWHPKDLSERAQWTIGQIFVAKNGDLIGIRQQLGIESPDLLAERLVPYVFGKRPGDWIGRPLFRAPYREWLLKDRLLRVDAVNHEKAGGILISEAPKDATPAEIEALGRLAAAARVGGGGAVPNGTTPVFIRGTGSDVIGSINRHDEAMAREFLMMFMALGTSSSGGNRALAGSFLDWFAIAQEAIAIWFRDTFQKQAIERYVTYNWGAQDYVPQLKFRRPEAANPLDQLANAVNQPAGDPAAVGLQTPDGDVVPVAAYRRGMAPGAFVVDEETRQAINAAHAGWERDNRPAATRAAQNPHKHRVKAAEAVTTTPTGAAVSLPDRPLRRDVFPHEITAAIDFAQVDTNWANSVAQLVADWQSIRAAQIAELATQIAEANGDLANVAQIQAAAAGGDLIAARLTAMAHTGALEAVAEAAAQGVPGAVPPDLATLEAELAARGAALEQLLANSLSQAAAGKAVQITGGSLTASDVAAQVTDYLAGLSDTYLADTFGGAMSAAQNAGRMAAMDENNATLFYASELLDVNTCDPCAEIDGTEYATAADAAVDYPAGGYRDCDGGPRCRGLVVAVYDEAQTTA
jgi:hypothetical protein